MSNKAEEDKSEKDKSEKFLARCREYDHQEWRRRQRMRHVGYILLGSVLWIWLVSCIAGTFAEKLCGISMPCNHTSGPPWQLAKVAKDAKEKESGKKDEEELKLVRIPQVHHPINHVTILTALLILCAAAFPIIPLWGLFRDHSDD